MEKFDYYNFQQAKKPGYFLQEDKKVDGLVGAEFYRTEIQEMLCETQDLGILDLIYKILIQTKN